MQIAVCKAPTLKISTLEMAAVRDGLPESVILPAPLFGPGKPGVPETGTAPHERAKCQALNSQPSTSRRA